MSAPLSSINQRLFWALENCVELLKLRIANPDISGPAYAVAIREAEKALRLSRGEPEDHLET